MQPVDFVIIADKKRITRESFERWYAGQSKYRKLSDRTPEELEEIRMAEKKKEKVRRHSVIRWTERTK